MQVQDYDHSFIVDRISVWVLILIDMMLWRIFCREIFISSVSKQKEKSQIQLLMLFAFFWLSGKLEQSFCARANRVFQTRLVPRVRQQLRNKSFLPSDGSMSCVLSPAPAHLSEHHHTLPADLSLDPWCHRALVDNESPFPPRNTHQC